LRDQQMTSRSVSVVIPCFNQGRYLREALDSVFAQTHPPDEVVVVDDGSTDSTAAIAGAYPAVRYVRQSNRGLARARNRGLRETTGDHVVMLDADDRLLPEALASGVSELAVRPDHAFVFGRCERIDARGRRLPTVAPPPIEGDYYQAFLRHNHVWTPAVAMFRRSVCGPLLQFDPAVGPAADYDLYLRLARQRRVYGHGRLVAEYRLHDASMSRDPAVMLQATMRVLKAQRRWIGASAGRAAAYDYGVTAFRHHYASQVLEQIRAAAREPSRWGVVLRAAAALLRHHPGGVLRGAARGMQDLVWRAAGSRRAGA
jgi:glycosyltransferase involved in cell wall biosynthesis